jgi:aminoglycoside phosphotransferase (APT) family kinase protein
MLRLDPYYRTAAERRPDIAQELHTLADDTAVARDCLVHGDFSPKNVMVGKSTWVLDWEVAHLGDVAFDPAFMLSHLLLKCLARPDLAPEFAAVADAFISELQSAGRDLDWTRVHRHLGALLIARVVGKSPVDYLTVQGQAAAERVGATMLRHPAEGPPRLLDVLVQP